MKTLCILTLSAVFAQAGNQDAGPTTYTFKTVKGLPIQADVYRLPGDEVRPAIVWIHGGALISGSRKGLNAEQRKRYLQAGYVIVSIDYRLAPETKLKGIIEDVQDAFRWVRAKGPELFKIDPKRIAVIGHSAGGYLTLMSGFAVEPRPQALVPFYGYGDITNEWYSRPDAFYSKQPLVSKEDAYKAVGTKETTNGAGRGKFYLYCRQNGLWPKEVAGHDPDKDPRAFDPFCPIRNVTKDYPPTLFLHGDKDTDVPYQQSVDMAKELKKHGVAHDLISMKGYGHGFDGKGMKDAKVAAAFDQVLAFLQKHVPTGTNAPKMPKGVILEEQPTDSKQTKIVFIAGSNFYKPGEHEYIGGCAVLMDLVRQTPGVFPVLALDWPKKAETFAGAKAVVFFLDGGVKHPVLKGDRMAQMQKLVDAGTGVVMLHQGVDIPKKNGDTMRGWMGAAWEPGYSQRAHWATHFQEFPKHAITRGVTPFKIDDGWLNKLRFVPDRKGITPLLRTVSPKAADAKLDDAAIVSWAYQRPFAGRSFAFTGCHLHNSLAEEGYRRFLVNGILWSANVEISGTGAPVALNAAELSRYLENRAVVKDK